MATATTAGVLAGTRAPAQTDPRLRLGRLKTWTVAGALAAFATFVGLARAHVTGVTARAATGGGGPNFGAVERAFFGGGDGGGNSGFGFGTGAAGTSGSGGGSAAATTVS